jgi:hypothetical protein
MPVTYVYTENTIAEWRTYFNIMGANVGDLERLDLPYPSNVDLVTAINALYSGAMVPVGLLTNNNISIVGAVNELWSNIGPLPNLITPNKANIVAAINDVWTKANSGVFDGNVVIHGNLHVDYGIRANGNIDGYSDFNLFGNARVNGDLRVNGDYIFLNSNNIYMMDPILRVGTAEDGADYPGDDQRDRGISFGYFDAGLPRSGFFGFDRNKKAYYFLNDAYETDGYVILGNLANLNADYYFVSGKVLPNTQPSNGQVLVDIGEFYNRFSNIYANNIVTGNANIEFSANIYKDLTVGNIILPATTLNVDIGSANLRFDNIYAYGMNVLYLDLDLSGAQALVNSLVANTTLPNLIVDDANLRINDLWANGNVLFNDSLIELAANNLVADELDIGFYGLYADTAGPNTIIRSAGLYRDASTDDKRFRFFANLTPEVTIASEFMLELEENSNVIYLESNAPIINENFVPGPFLANNRVNSNILLDGDVTYALANVEAKYFIGNLSGYADWAHHIYSKNVIENGDTSNGYVFFSNTRSRLAVSNTGVGLNYNKVAGIFSLDVAAIGTGNGGVFDIANTDMLAEGLTNLYYTNNRAQAWFESYFTAATPLTFSNGVLDLTALTTDDIPEGATNFYYTDARARQAISAGDDSVIYDPQTGVLTVNISQLEGVTSVNGNTGDVTLTSDDVDEGTINLYFTEERWDEYVSLLTTDDVAEGNTNFYFSNARALAALHPDGTLDYDTNTGNLSVNVAGICNLVVASVNGMTGNVTLYTSNIIENGDTTTGNVYFSNSRARAAISVTGAGTYDQANGIISVPGPYGLDFKTFVFTLAAPSTVISGTDDFGKILNIGMTSALDVFVNGVRAIANVDYNAYNNMASSNVTFTSTVPAGTEITIREITGNIAVSQGYITQNVTDYLEVLNSIPTSASVSLDLNYGQNTNFYVNVTQSTTITWVNVPVSAGKVLVFTIFLNFGSGNAGEWEITWPASVRWDDNSPPIFTAIPDRLEAVTFFTINSGTLFYGYKNLSGAPNS